LPIEQALEVMAALLRALQAAHEHTLEIVHRDVKPSNVLFDGANRAHLADFGLAQLGGTSGRSQLEGVRKHPGTPAYMAPEQTSSTDYLTPAADIYAAGCVLFEMLTGKRYKRVRPGSKPSALRPEIPHWVDALAAKALAPDPFDRFEDAGDMLAALHIGRTQIVTEQEQRQAEAERQQQAAAERARRDAEQAAAAERLQLAEAERVRQAEAERQRLAEAERLQQEEAEQQHRAEMERTRQAEAERARLDAEQQAEAERQRLAEAEQARQMEAERQVVAERLRQAEMERERQADRQRLGELNAVQMGEATTSSDTWPDKTAAPPITSTTAQASLPLSKDSLTIIAWTALAFLWLVIGYFLISMSDAYSPALLLQRPLILLWAAAAQWIVVRRRVAPSRWWLTYSAGAAALAAVLGAVVASLFNIDWYYYPGWWSYFLVLSLELLTISTIQWHRLRRYSERAFLWIIGNTLLGTTAGLLTIFGPYLLAISLFIIYIALSGLILWWLLAHQAQHNTVGNDGVVAPRRELWQRLAGPPAGEIGVTPVSARTFLIMWAGFTVVFVAIMINLLTQVIQSMSTGLALKSVIPLLLFGIAVGQWVILRQWLTSTKWWLFYSAGGSALAAVVGATVIGNRSWPSPFEFLLVVSLQLLIVGAAQWLKLRYYVNHAYLWVIGSVLAGAAIWLMLFVANGSLNLVSLTGVVIYPLVTGIVMWWLLEYQAKERLTTD
jgi:hypothetical protein